LPSYGLFDLNEFLEVFFKLQKANTALPYSSTWKNSAPIGQILKKFDMGAFYKNL